MNSSGRRHGRFGWYSTIPQTRRPRAPTRKDSMTIRSLRPSTENTPRNCFREKCGRKTRPSRIPRRWLSIIAITTLLYGVTLGSNAAGQTPNRVEVRTLSLGIVSEVNQKEIEGYYRDFVGYVTRKLSSAPDVGGKVIVASTPSELAKLLGQQKVDFYMESTYSTYVINDVQGAGKLLLRRWQRGKPEYKAYFCERKQRSKPPGRPSR